jgi:hypothetical protein
MGNKIPLAVDQVKHFGRSIVFSTKHGPLQTPFLYLAAALSLRSPDGKSLQKK